MGTSTNAILFYGYCWGDETSRPWTIGKAVDSYDDSDWEERYATAKGITRPTRPYPDREVPRARENGYSATPKDYSAEEQSIIEGYRAYYTQKRAIAAESGIDVDTHCSGDCPMPFVCIAESKVVSHRGDMTEITTLGVGADWNERLRAFCDLMQIPIPDEGPKWWLVSDWS